MRTLDRNKRPFYYALYAGKTPYRDANGNRTGEKDIAYEPIRKGYGNISAARGSAGIAQFGIDLSYSRTIVLCGTRTSIAEDTTLWIGYGEVAEYGATVSYSAGDLALKDGTMKKYNGETWDSVPYNYRVVRVAKSLNFTMIAIREVGIE